MASAWEEVAFEYTSGRSIVSYTAAYLAGLLAEGIVTPPTQWRLARPSTFDGLSDSDGFTPEDLIKATTLAGDIPMQVVRR